MASDLRADPAAACRRRPSRSGITCACSKAPPVVVAICPVLLPVRAPPGVCAGLAWWRRARAQRRRRDRLRIWRYAAVPRCMRGGSGLLGAGAALVPDDVYRLSLGEPGAGGERLVELGGAQLLADLGYQFLLQPPHIRPGRQADPL